MCGRGSTKLLTADYKKIFSRHFLKHAFYCYICIAKRGGLPGWLVFSVDCSPPGKVGNAPITQKYGIFALSCHWLTQHAASLQRTHAYFNTSSTHARKSKKDFAFYSLNRTFATSWRTYSRSKMQKKILLFTRLIVTLLLRSEGTHTRKCIKDFAFSSLNRTFVAEFGIVLYIV